MKETGVEIVHVPCKREPKVWLSNCSNRVIILDVVGCSEVAETGFPRERGIRDPLPKVAETAVSDTRLC